MPRLIRISLFLLSAPLWACDPDPGIDGGTPDSGTDSAVILDGASDTSTGADTGADVAIDSSPAECGDGARDPAEACDDGNRASGDGCSSDCTAVEEDFACGTPGTPCVRVVTCGNARIEGDEMCDDRNTESGDGCDSECQREEGWFCPVAGRACVAAACGDGVLAGFEVCDDGGRCSGATGGSCTSDEECEMAGDGDTCSPRAGDGCSAECQLEEGFVCRVAGSACETSSCGDGVMEGTEECDDGNPLIGDGCTPFCTREPSCTDGSCVAVCGDDVVFAPESCDDGNTLNGDGCSADCQVETGYSCVEVPLPDPPMVELPVVVRDFIPSCDDSGVTARLPDTDPAAVPPYGHPDFQCFNGAETGMVGLDLVDGRPVRLETATRLSSAESFDLWYRTDDDYNRTVVQRLSLGSMGSGAYRFDSDSFYPLSSPVDGSDPAGFPVEGLERLNNDGSGSGAQNFFFTSEVRFWFEYEGTETLVFSGDDDVWVFINGKLAVDLGGVHGRQDGSITLSECADSDPAANHGECLAPLDLRVGGIYEAVVFQAERHTTRSQYQLTLSNFNRAPSACESVCGDGVVASDESCDEGDDNGAEYGGCSALCELTPFCGDGEVQADFGEICDDGLNLGGGPSACAPGCQELGARCGDGVVQIDAGEQCDDGNTVSGDGCSMVCRSELI